MPKKKHKLNPHCPVVGCKAKAPHAIDRTVSDFIKVFGDPTRLTWFARLGMSQLLISMQQDWDGKREFAWFCRIRQTEELFYRTLYAVFFASEAELPHIMSGEQPNSIIPCYRKVNDELYMGRGGLTEELPGLGPDSILNTPLDLLHSGAHTAIAALMSGLAFARNADLHPYVDKLHWKVRINVDRLDWIHKLFANGANKDAVLKKYKEDRNWRDELETLKNSTDRA
jgi:hypothetical protein